MRCAVFLMLLACAAPARAEWFADLYAGVAYTPRSDVIVVVARPGGSVDHTFRPGSRGVQGQITLDVAPLLRC